MEFSSFITLLKAKRSTIFTIVLVVLVATAGLSLIVPLKYEADSKLLIAQNTSNSDPYTVSKSNEYLGNLFAQVVKSGSFYNYVLESSYNIDRNYFSGDYNSQMKKWSKTVETDTLSDTGIINIKVYHTNPYQAQQIALAINDVLVSKNSSYQGNGQTLKMNIIDQPLVSNYPTKPNIAENLIIALAGSLLFSLFYIYLFPEERYNIKLWPSKHRGYMKNTGHRIAVDYHKSENKSAVTGDTNDYRLKGNIDNILK